MSQLLSPTTATVVDALTEMLQLPEHLQIELEQSHVMQRYLTTLPATPLTDLQRRPALMADEERTLRKRLTDLTTHEYRLLVQSHDAAVVAEDALTDMQSTLAQLHTGVSIEGKLEEFQRSFAPVPSASAKTIMNERRRIARWMAAYDAIVEIVECPALLNALVGAGMYDEALDLVAFLSRLMARYPGVPVLTSLMGTMGQGQVGMVRQLVRALQSPTLSMHECVKFIGYLRRMHRFSESELRVLFLRARYDRYRSADVVDQEQASNQVKAWIEHARAVWIDCITQYQAIFSDGTRTAVTSQDMSSAILSGFLTYAVNEFCRELDARLAAVEDVTALSNLLTQSMHFGVALGRKNVDVRWRLTDIYRRHLVRLLTQFVQQGVEGFNKELERNGVSRMTSAGSTNGDLVGFPPVAALVNCFLGMLNAYRVMPMIDVHDAVRHLIEHETAGIKKRLEQHADALAILQVWTDIAMPLISQSFSALLSLK